MSLRPITENTLFYGDNLFILRAYIPSESIDLIYLDPPCQDGKPRKDGHKVYLDEMPGKSVGDIWTDIDRIANTSGERLGYPTQKPIALFRSHHTSK